MNNEEALKVILAALQGIKDALDRPAQYSDGEILATLAHGLPRCRCGALSTATVHNPRFSGFRESCDDCVESCERVGSRHGWIEGARMYNAMRPVKR